MHGVIFGSMADPHAQHQMQIQHLIVKCLYLLLFLYLNFFLPGTSFMPPCRICFLSPLFSSTPLSSVRPLCPEVSTHDNGSTAGRRKLDYARNMFHGLIKIFCLSLVRVLLFSDNNKVPCSSIIYYSCPVPALLSMSPLIWPKGVQKTK